MPAPDIFAPGDRVAYSADHLARHAIRGGPIARMTGTVVGVGQDPHAGPFALVAWDRGTGEGQYPVMARALARLQRKAVALGLRDAPEGGE